MKLHLLKYLFYLLLGFNFLFAGCKTQQPGFANSSQPTGTSPDNVSGKPATPAPGTQLAKTVAPPAPKLVYDSTKISFKIKQKSETETYTTQDDDDDEPVKVTTSKTSQIEKYKKREKEKGNWLSGGFLAAGMAVLLASLVLVIIGSGPAGLLAIIGGTLFLAGFIFTLVALLSR